MIKNRAMKWTMLCLSLVMMVLMAKPLNTLAADPEPKVPLGDATSYAVPRRSRQNWGMSR